MTNSSTTYYVCLFIVGVLLISCKKDTLILEEPAAYVLKVPAGFAFPEIPDDNPLNAAKIALGKKLFYEKALSVDSTISCGSCHKQAFAFSDNIAISTGVANRPGFRNTSSLANIAWAPEMLMDGGNPTIETQVYVPIETHFEMDFNMVLLVDRLSANQDYVTEFKAVFGKGPDPFGITRALAAFERTIISGNSNYDKYYHQGNNSALNASEINGMNLFFSPGLNCSGCHSGYLFTNYTYQNNGYFSDYSSDSGRARITLLHEDAGKFKVPSLRNIGLTAPYMHNGEVATLNQIIEQYKNGGTSYENQSELIQPFTLTITEQQDLINFLLSLTDDELLNNSELAE